MLTDRFALETTVTANFASGDFTTSAVFSSIPFAAIVKSLVVSNLGAVIVHATITESGTDRVILSCTPNPDGGLIVAQGTPEEVANITESYTGKYLKAILSNS